MFSHEKLNVYQKALICVASLFLDTAEASAAKSAAYLDLCCRSGEMEQNQRDNGIELLGRIAQMLHVMADG